MGDTIQNTKETDKDDKNVQERIKAKKIKQTEVTIVMIRLMHWSCLSSVKFTDMRDFQMLLSLLNFLVRENML